MTVTGDQRPRSAIERFGPIPTLLHERCERLAGRGHRLPGVGMNLDENCAGTAFAVGEQFARAFEDCFFEALDIDLDKVDLLSRKLAVERDHRDADLSPCRFAGRYRGIMVGETHYVRNFAVERREPHGTGMISRCRSDDFEIAKLV